MIKRKRKRSARLERHSCIIYIKQEKGWQRYTSSISKEEHIKRFNVDFAIGLIPLTIFPETHIELRSADFGYGICLHEPKKEIILRESCSALIYERFMKHSFD